MRSLVLGLGICVVFLLGCEPPRRPVGMDPDLRPPDTTPADEATDGSEQLQEAQQERARQLAERQPRRPTEEQLQEQLRSTTPTERISAARALWRMGSNAKEAIPALIEALGDSESEVRGLAARALGQMGADASEAVPVLTKMLSDEANYAVTVLTPDTFLGGGYYMRAGSHTVYVRANAAEALRRIEPVAAETVPAFVVLLSDGEPAVRGAAARVLGRIEVGPNPAIRALALLLHDDAEYRPETEYEDPGRFVRTVGSIVVPGFATEMVRVGDNAADALAQFGPEAVLPTLKELLDDEDAQARRGAAKGLGLLRAEAKTAIPELIAALQDESWDVRLSVTEALGAIGPEAAVAVPDLIRLLVAEDSHDSRAAPVERM
jgi:HEAT repeat protein